ncbi:uncharacterized protein CLUP02_06832 [Colletotrichum lupini]|uniref:Uncharacterized protein n=1 Tax=Colletotrichum lupini TaxID=145971 RepID=A0A9Q8SQ00_9PEZI|nr:uncharacterized protein CLUP02_06832 [Colletotrichum lupini]UQC81346.1 hypothetical protein CLUP02_06832 [Colletotrichum lupini]
MRRLLAALRGRRIPRHGAELPRSDHFIPRRPDPEAPSSLELLKNTERASCYCLLKHCSLPIP